jgi:hypothetical protein
LAGVLRQIYPMKTGNWPMPNDDWYIIARISCGLFWSYRSRGAEEVHPRLCYCTTLRFPLAQVLPFI